MFRQRLGIAAVTPAERQARHRAKLRQQNRTGSPTSASHPPPRPRGWTAAVTTLIALQDEYRA
jgi:hypothetical protein